MPQCAACGKFMGAKEGITCPKCKSKSHNECVRVPTGVTVSDSWRCGDCQNKAPKGRDPATPIRGMQDGYLTQTQESSIVVSDGGASSQVNIDVVSALREEMRSEFLNIQKLMTLEFKDSKDNMGSFFEEMRELKKELSATRSCFNERMDTFETRLVSLEQSRDNLPESAHMSSLEQALVEVKMQLNDREQEYLLNDVVITGFKEENAENPTHLVSLLGSKMGITVDDRDIVLAEREGPVRRPKDDGPARARRIVVRFSRRAVRDAYLGAARVRRGLTTTDLGVDGGPTRLYVNERLTRTNSQIFAKAREQCRQHIWKYCWSKEGRIYVRKEQGTPYVRIRDEKDIDQIFSKDSV